MRIASARSASGIGRSSVARSSAALRMLRKCCSMSSVSEHSARNTFRFAIIIADSPCTPKASFNDVQALCAVSAFLTYVISFSETRIRIIPSARRSRSSHFLCSSVLSLSLSLVSSWFLLTGKLRSGCLLFQRMDVN